MLGPSPSAPVRSCIKRWWLLWVAVALAAFPPEATALPKRLVLALDGIAYRDLQALQAGFTTTNFWGKPARHEAFTAAEGYFPVSRMVSTFPSTSDVAWTDIFGDRPLPGYQRTYFSAAANSQMAINGVTTTMEHERQMHWQVQDGFRRAMGYLSPYHLYQYETRELVRNFLESRETGDNYYAYIRTSDDAQHLDRDIFAMLVELDQQLQGLRAECRKQEGRDLQIVILSDHGNNHAGRGERVAVVPFLEKAGYRIATSLVKPKDVVLPTTGIESWVEIHNLPQDTEALAMMLTNLPGADVVTARLLTPAGRFLVLNSKGERGCIDWEPDKNAYRYSSEAGDPLDYRPVVEELARRNLLDANGFAGADDWMAATFSHHYPLAPERIVRGLTRVTLNPATILISLDNRYVHDGWLVDAGSRLVTMGGTHGALDDLNSDGIVLCNFTPTRDTSSARVAELFEGFSGVVDYRAAQEGAEWATGRELTLARIAHAPLDRDSKILPGDELFLRVWTPKFTSSNAAACVEVTINKVRKYLSARTRRWETIPADSAETRFTCGHPVSFPDGSPYDRLYALPAGLALEPQTEYEISVGMRDSDGSAPIFAFTFLSDALGRPTAY